MSVAFSLAKPASQPASQPERTRAAMGSIGSVSLFDRNSMIFAEGDEAEHVYKVVSGGVRLCKMLSDGRRQIVEFALPGDYFGIDWLERHALTAEAMVDTTTVCYGRGRLTRLGDENSDVRAEIFATLRHDLWAAQNHLVILGRQSARERVASFLLQLLERRRDGARNRIDLPMTRQDIADYLGLTIETVCRVLTALKREAVIDIPDRHSLTVRNRAALEDACVADD